MATQQTPKIGEILLERHWVNADELARATRTQKLTHSPLGEILLQQASINKRQLARALRWQRFVRMALVAGTCSISLSQPALASEAQQITDDLVNSLQGTASTSQTRNRRSTDRLLTGASVNSEYAPAWTLLQGEYSAGVNRYTEGLRYKANWSDDNVKVEVRYQF